jgi:hypothetical protein
MVVEHLTPLKKAEVVLAAERFAMSRFASFDAIENS